MGGSDCLRVWYSGLWYSTTTSSSSHGGRLLHMLLLVLRWLLLLLRRRLLRPAVRGYDGLGEERLMRWEERGFFGRELVTLSGQEAVVGRQAEAVSVSDPDGPRVAGSREVKHGLSTRQRRRAIAVVRRELLHEFQVLNSDRFASSV